ncbi:hypothetical protein UPYG_G00033470 [Umbra pygmaea]|uniref:Cystatin fetuin-A-type domain-containing protein n=1 Tax=Umbra pygmaea TaxID=75934 RepID=A0ABD0XNA2_UMBPY
MRGLTVVSVLVLWALACASEPARDTSGRRWTCDENDNEPGAKLAMMSINKNHFHGYKFQLSKISSSTVEKDESGCKIHLQLNLQETTCHIVNPKPFEECEIRPQSETQVNAHCNVTLIIAEGNSTEVSKHSCNSEAVSAEEMVRLCPDCPVLLPLHSPEGLESVKAGLNQFNSNHNLTSYFKLLEVGRITSGYMVMTGINYYTEFAIVETECNAKSRIEKMACKPLCHHNARHGLCKSSLLGTGAVDVDCVIYEALNTSSHGRNCGNSSYHPGHRVRPWQPKPLPGHLGPLARVPIGPGPHRESGESLHEFPFPHCHGFVKIPPSIHPLCPFPPRHYQPHTHGHGPHTGHSPLPCPPRGKGHGPHPHGHGPPPGHSPTSQGQGHGPPSHGQGPPPGHSPPHHGLGHSCSHQ